MNPKIKLTRVKLEFKKLRVMVAIDGSAGSNLSD